MTPDGFRALEVGDLDAVVRLREVAFGGVVDEEQRARRREGLERGHYWGIVVDGEVRSVASVGMTDHWFGGRRVPCQHVGGVAVPPEHRGRGVGSATMRGVLSRGVADGAALSLLFPATVPLYRRLGWEHAGLLVRYRIDARSAPALGANLRPLAEGAGAEADWAAIRACHEATGRALNGPAVRTEDEWAALRAARFTYVLDAEVGSGVEAYLCYSPRRAADDWQYSIAVADWGATTARGSAALLGFVGSHGSLGKDATFGGSFPHPWAFLTTEQDVRRDGGMFWMARGLDLSAAVAARGYPPGLTLAVTLAVTDAELPTARGPWRLEVHGGGATLAPATDAEVVLDTRALGPLYTGFTSPAQLALAGLATGPDDALARLGAAFAGPPPVLFDFF